MLLKKILLPTLIGLSFSLSSFAYSENSLRQSIDDYIYTENNLKNAVIGLKIRDLKTNQDIYSLNSSKLFTPASNTKVLTSLIALEKLGKDYKFKTILSSDAKISNKTLNGDLYFIFKGDPTFKHQDIDYLFSKLKENGIEKIEGNIIIDKSYFDDILYGSGWMWDDMDSCDSSPISPIVIDNNCVNAKIILDNSNISIDSKNINTFNVKDLKKAEKEDIKTKFENNVLNISGEIKESTDIEQSIIKPELYLESYLKNNILNEFDFKGKIIFNSNKDENISKNILAFKESEPLSKILKFFNEESHNLTGEILTKTVGTIDSIPSSTKKGINVLNKYLKEKFKYNDFRVVDGSGLSRYNLFSPDLMVDVLTYLYQNDEYRDVVLEAFPLGAKEGTLKNRLKDMKKFKVIAKSGSMTGVNCLSGYLINNSQVYVFSIMINNSNLSGKELRDIQDKILYMI
ncbi:MAG: D-alanyl-D-alanine carboxypeptidase/D-alanyl-D-alanine-endopeptidase [Candidatus Sericytochromatia bacterium]